MKQSVSVVRYLPGIFVLLIALVLLSSCEINSVTPAKAANPPTWSPVTVPIPTNTTVSLVKSISPRDVWIAGVTQYSAQGSQQTSTTLYLLTSR